MSAAGATSTRRTGEVFDGEREDLRGGLLGLVGVRGELDAARLPASSNEDLRLDDHLRGASGEEALGRGTCGGRRGRHLAVRDRQPGAAQEFARLCFVQFHLASACC